MALVLNGHDAEDIIRLNDLQLTVCLRTGARWPKSPSDPVLQPVLVTLDLFYSVHQTAITDDLSHSINYSAIAKLLKKTAESTGPVDSLHDLSHRFIDVLLGEHVRHLRLTVVQSRPPLHVDSVGLQMEVSGAPRSWNVLNELYFVHRLECDLIVGVNDCEREETQRVCFDIDVQSPQVDHSPVDFRQLIRRVYDAVLGSSYYTLESLASLAALEALKHLSQQTDINQASWTVRIKASKPYALVFAGSSEIEIRRTFTHYPGEFGRQSLLNNAAKGPSLSVAALAFGSNVGDRVQNIEHALGLIETTAHDGQPDWYINVVDTSFLYETSPMYVTDQPTFLNGACVVETNIPPVALLSFLKKIESRVGRVPSFRNGPRAVDLDLVFYNNDIIDTRSDSSESLEGQLVVPHPRLAEREFVLRPLNDMSPTYVHPLLNKTVQQLLDKVQPDPFMRRLVPFPTPLSSIPREDLPPASLTSWSIPIASFPHTISTKTRIMATLNVTPDSFSDGSDHNSLPAAVAQAKNALISSDPAILDVGGYSTRPGAAFVSEQEEIDRIVPVIRAVRQGSTTEPWYDEKTPISIDTFRSKVAKAAIEAGANCINDVYSFCGPDPSRPSEEIMEEMKLLSRSYCVPVILMHSRGDAGTNKDYSAYDYVGQDAAVLEGIRVELGDKVNQIVKGKGGVRRWLVIVDPGIGFNKTVQDNIQVLRSASSIVADLLVGKERSKRNPLFGFPFLIGPSRKSFLGSILETGVNGRKTVPKERGWATAAAVASSSQQGALIVRVHDVQEMTDVVKVCNEIW